MSTRARTNRRARWTIVFSVAFWVVALGAVRVAVVPPEACGDIGPAEARDSARLAGQWLVAGQQPDGRYTYEYFDEEDRAGSDYNVVRHAGVTMSLYQVAGRLGDDAAFAAAERGTAWMLDNLAARDDWVALADDPRAKLGSTALMTVALAERRLLTGDERHDEVLRGLGRFMVFLQRPDGGFHIAYELDQNAPDTVNTSVYYPGEALWGLAMLHEAFPDEGFDVAAWKAADFITLQRDEVEDVKWPPLNDHWAAYGMAEMVEWEPGLADHHIDYARRLSGRFSLFLRFEAQKESHAIAAWLRGDDQRTASLGTWVEGMAALWRIAAQDERMADIEDRIRERTACGAALLAARQTPASAPPTEAGGWFADGVTRMDDQQHAISGLLYTADALEDRTKREPDRGGP